MTSKEIFVAVKQHLLTQNKKSFLSKDQVLKIKQKYQVNGSTYAEGEVSCAYRGEDNCKCAVGILIPDELYSEIMEGEIPYSLNKFFSDEKFSEMFKTHSDLLFELQGIHDNYEPKDWKKKLEELEKELGFK